MFITIIRAIILYVLIIGAVRLMGKRQVGELQPSELVITILISEIAAIPMQDNGLPLINSIVPLFLLVAFEVITSVISMKSRKFRSIMQGNPVIVIRDGVIDQQQMKRLRLNIDDLLEALRQKDVFDISHVQYAIAETNGNMSVLLNPEKQPATVDLFTQSYEDSGFPHIIINDGKIIETELNNYGMSMEKLKKEVKKQSLNVKEILLMTTDKSGKITIIKKDDQR